MYPASRPLFGTPDYSTPEPGLLCSAPVDVSRIGFLGLIVLIIAVVGIVNFLVSASARNHPDNPLAQAAIHFYGANP